jgi:hypothetical protein
VKDQKESRGASLLFLSPRCQMGVVGKRHSSTTLLLGKRAVTHCPRVGVENLTRTGIRSLDFRVRSEPLYGLRYSGPQIRCCRSADKSLTRPTSRLKDILKEKHRGKVTKWVWFLHETAPAHWALATQKKLACLGFQCLVSFLVGLRTYQHPCS